MGLRANFRAFIQHSVGNGMSVFFWHDNWAGVGPFLVFFSSKEIARMGFSGKEKVADSIVDGQWRWPVEVLSKFPSLRLEGPSLFENDQDITLWCSRDCSTNPYKSS